MRLNNSTVFENVNGRRIEALDLEVVLLQKRFASKPKSSGSSSPILAKRNLKTPEDECPAVAQSVSMHQ